MKNKDQFACCLFHISWLKSLKPLRLINLEKLPRDLWSHIKKRSLVSFILYVPIITRRLVIKVISLFQQKRYNSKTYVFPIKEKSRKLYKYLMGKHFIHHYSIKRAEKISFEFKMIKIFDYEIFVQR